MRTNRGWRRRLPRLMAAGAGTAAVAALALVIALGGRTGGSVSPGPSTGPGSAMCVEPYDGPASIAARTVAFDGTVIAIDGERVTFTVNTRYRGSDGATITLDAPGMTGSAITSAGGPTLAIGDRYLVAGDGGFAWACGYTQAYDFNVASAWAAATGG